MSLDLQRMRGYKPRQPVDMIVGLLRWNESSELCRVCEGGGWVGPHDVGCPLDEAATFYEIKTYDRVCPTCHHKTLVFFKDQPSKPCRGCCFQSKSDVLNAANVAARHARRLAKSDKRKARAYARDAKALLDIYKDLELVVPSQP